MSEGELAEMTDVDDSPHHLADRQPVAVAMEVAEHGQRSTDRMRSPR